MQIALISAASAFIIIALPFLAVILFLVQHFYLRTSKQLRLLDLEAKAPLYSQFMDTISGLATIRAFDWQRRLQDDNYVLLDSAQRPYYLLFCIQRWLNLVLNLLIAGLGVVLLGVAIGLKGTVSAGAVGLAMVNIITLGETLQYAIIEWTALETSLGAVSRISGFIRDTPCESESSKMCDVPGSWPSHGAIEFRNISASYGYVIHELRAKS
jgi:ATP-binding cassette, subfamily C (CFTR/MRP), member 1